MQVDDRVSKLLNALESLPSQHKNAPKTKPSSYIGAGYA